MREPQDVLANRLRPTLTSLCPLEAGKKDDYFWIDVPVGYLYTIANPRTDWCFETEPEAGLNNRSIGYARGKVLGGSSSINAMIYMRGQKRITIGGRPWEIKVGIGRASYIFRRSEDYQHGSDDFHGTGGELRVEERRVNWEILDV